MTEEKRLTVAELSDLVRKNAPDFRVYNWREVEDMRNRLAALSMGATQ